MPFTFSHPAAAVPFRRSRLMLSGLVIGSMAPDFQYFLHWTGQGRDAHTYPGIVLFTIPAAMVVFAVFHLLLKWPLVSLFPVEAQKRLVEPAVGFRWNGVSTAVIATVSLLTGVVTHLAWDSFTHADGWIVQQWPALHRPLFFLGRTAIQPFKIAQHASTVVDLLVLFGWAWQWYRRAKISARPLPPGLRPRTKVAVIAAGSTASLAAAAVVIVRHTAGPRGLGWLQHVLILFSVTTISIAFSSLIVYSSAWWVWTGQCSWNWRAEEKALRVGSSQ